jgi:hypothetical protein
MTTRVVAALTLLAAGCSSGAPSPGAESAQGAITRIDSSAIVLESSQGIGDPTRAVIRDSAAWQAFWAQAHAQVEPAPPVPAVSFADSMLLVAALGTRSSGGYSVRIDSVARGTTLRVFVTAVSPGPGCVTTMAIAWPVQVARVARFDGSVDFVDAERVDTCR